MGGNHICIILGGRKPNKELETQIYRSPEAPSVPTLWLGDLQLFLSQHVSSNTIFHYDHVILGWQHLRKFERSSQEKQQTQYKVQWHPVTIEKRALPIPKLWAKSGLIKACT
eukprot:1144902-Pelagomonas_calceolata.AAC.1